MANKAVYHFAEPVTVFQDRRLPEPARPVGYAALIHAHDLAVPLPRNLAAIGLRHKVAETDGWRLYTPRYAPGDGLADHLTFALKHEGIDLAVLKRLFAATGPAPIESVIRAAPTGAYARRIWFLYEWLTASQLDVPDASKASYVPVIDPKMQWAGPDILSVRHRVKNNLPGTPAFCPMIFLTPLLRAAMERDIAAAARAVAAAVPADLLARTAAFLLLKDSRSSFAIEGEHPPQDRIQRWGQAIGRAGQQPLDLDELLRLQRIVIGDARFVRLGLRSEGGFVGEHDRISGQPLPDHISARPEDLPGLIDGLLAFDRRTSQNVDPVLAAAVLAFGFVYIHPFEDGNGRLHRYLIHHALAERGFNPPGLVFPVSAVILERIDAYRRVLESYSARLLPLIRWEPTENGNVRVTDDTADHYRFFDATPQAEFLYDCVIHTIEEELPAETAFLRCYDDFKRRIAELIDMPDRLSDLLFRFLHQNNGVLSQRAREREFKALSEAETEQIEAAYLTAFSGQR